MSKKNAMTSMYLILLIFSLITLLVIIFQLYPILFSAADSSDSNACSFLFSNGLSRGTYYTSDLSNFNEDFFDFTEEKCASFTLQVESRNLDLISEKIYNCWETLDGGDVILPREMFGEGICYYCGELILDETVKFDQLQDSLNKKYGMIENDFQATKVTSKNLGVFYYQYRENLDTLDSIGSYIDEEINHLGGLFEKTGDFFQPDVKIYTGITFSELNENNPNEFYLDGVPLNEKLNCKTIVSRD